jgi:hypothetical protein
LTIIQQMIVMRLRVTVQYGYCVRFGTNYCACDGSGGAPPCINPGGADAGCANSTGLGARLVASGGASVSADDLAFTADQLPALRPALLFVGTNAIAGGAGMPFGDGLRCAGGDVRRLGLRISDASGSADFGPGLASTGGWLAGDLRRFQVLYRDPVNSPCGTLFNLTNGFELVFVP